MIGHRVVFTGQNRAEWEQFALPAALEPHELLLRTRYSAVSVGTEMAIYSGTHIGFQNPAATYPRYPHPPGYAAVGVVEAVGAAAQGVQVGDQVGYPGRHSSHMVWDTRRAPWAVLPQGLSPTVGALARLATISLNGVRLGGLTLGASVAVLGGGLIGQFAAQLARLSGGRPVVLFDMLDRRLAVARRCGLDQTVNPAHVDAPQMRRDMTTGRGFDVVIEASGAPAAVAQALALAADFGRVVLLGSPRGRVEIDPYAFIHRPGLTIVGAHERTTPQTENMASRWTQQGNFELILRLMAAGDLHVEPLLSHVLPASDAPQVYERLRTQPEDLLGVVFDWTA